MRVKATREGLVGKSTSSGYVIDTVVSFVALPDVKALHRHVKITNPANGKSCYAEVLDVGPWNTHDDLYVFGGQQPAAEMQTGIGAARFFDEFGRHTNGAGIDLGQRVWIALGMADNAEVEWEFI